MSIKSIVFVASTLVLTTSANAALIERMGGLAYYDNVTNLTWLSDANYAQTSGYDVDGRMTWSEAKTWASNLDVSGVTGWRLSSTLQPDASCGSQSSNGSYGFNCTGSELGNMFHILLGGNLLTPISGSHNANYDLFSNVQDYSYWTSTSNANDSNEAWSFSFGSRYQTFSKLKLNTFNAWAVQSGDATVDWVPQVPVPAAAWLFGSGLLGLIGVAGRKKA